MHRQDVLRQRRRDAALTRLRRTNQGIAGGATALLLAFAVIAARGFSGHSTAGATPAGDSPQGATGAVAHAPKRHRSWHPPLKPPSAKPKHRHKHAPAVQQTTPVVAPVVVSGGS